MYSIKPKKSQLLVIIPVAIVAILSIGTSKAFIASGKAHVSKEERTYKIKENDFPKGVIEIVQVKNLHSELFPEDFGIEVKNIGVKPIYGISISLRFPDTKFKHVLGYYMSYGALRLSGINELANTDDIPIKIGKTGVVKLPLVLVESFKQSMASGSITASGTRNMLIHVQVVNFGDGTGFMGRDPYPAKVMNSINKLKIGTKISAFYPISILKIPTLNSPEQFNLTSITMMLPENWTDN